MNFLEKFFSQWLHGAWAQGSCVAGNLVPLEAVAPLEGLAKHLADEGAQRPPGQAAKGRERHQESLIQELDKPGRHRGDHLHGVVAGQIPAKP